MNGRKAQGEGRLSGWTGTKLRGGWVGENF